MSAAEPTLSGVAVPIPGRRRSAALLAAGALVLASLFWGTSDVASKTALETLPPLTLSALRFGCALIALEIICIRIGVRPALGRRVAVLGLVGIGINYTALYLGLQWTRAADASLIHGAAPALAVFLAVVFRGERPGRTALVGVFASLCGVVIVALASGDHPRLEIGGNLLVLGSALCWALFIVLGRPVFAETNPVGVLTGAMRYAMLILIPVAAIEPALFHEGSISDIRIPAGALALYLGVACSAATFLLWGYALKHLQSSHAAAFGNLGPILGVAAGALILGDPLNARHLFGIVLVVGGVTVVAKASAARETD
ncbi:DMT family transporter [soil metagenome]